MSEQKQKRLLIVVGVVAGTLLVAVVGLFLKIQKENQEDRYLRMRDRSNIRQALVALEVFQMEENRYPDQLMDLYPDYTDNKNLLKSPCLSDSQLYIFIPPPPDASGEVPPDMIILISPILYPRGQRLVGYADRTVDFISEKDLPDF